MSQARGLTPVMKACGAISASGLALLSVLVVADVFLRNTGLVRWPWINELTEYLLTISTFTGAPWVLHHHGHVNVDVLLRSVSEAKARWLVRASNLVGGAISAILLVVAVRVTLDSHALGSLVFKNLIFPEWYLMTPMVLCFGLCTAEFLARILRREVRP
ncbi:TRAP transporter small permease (plasmid) [Salipiger sp. H15]|uniref:TRAP transporter small permease protein n=1 Tax=Alloyangia sp. H15 TaxID=3029062 RepID=A0AAU8AT76_9RHOB